MLLTVHHPITDARAFFPDELGRAVSLNAGYAGAFIRSAGGRATRRQGSDSDLDENAFYSLFRQTFPSALTNRPNPALKKLLTQFIRYYQLDDVAGRLEMGLVLKSRGWARKLELRDVLRLSAAASCGSKGGGRARVL